MTTKRSKPNNQNNKIEGYLPTDKESFMNERQIQFFQGVLLNWKEELLNGSTATIETLKVDTKKEPDLNDRATLEIDRSLELRTRDRERKLINKIDQALARIKDGSYGYCTETGEEIGIKRLIARPIATMTVEAQEKHEREEKVQHDILDEEERF